MFHQPFPKYKELPRPKVAHCRSCQARIVWLRTKAGKRIPVDAGTVEAGAKEYDPKRHISHFATCPEAAKFRRGKSDKQEELPL